jgi:hypothetical protein
MKRVPVRLREGQLVVVSWLDAAGAERLAADERLLPIRVRTVGWVWERMDAFLTLHSELFEGGQPIDGVRDATTIPASMLRSVRVLFDEGEV